MQPGQPSSYCHSGRLSIAPVHQVTGARSYLHDPLAMRILGGGTPKRLFAMRRNDPSRRKLRLFIAARNALCRGCLGLPPSHAASASWWCLARGSTPMPYRTTFGKAWHLRSGPPIHPSLEARTAHPGGNPGAPHADLRSRVDFERETLAGGLARRCASIPGRRNVLPRWFWASCPT